MLQVKEHEIQTGNGYGLFNNILLCYTYIIFFLNLANELQTLVFSIVDIAMISP